MIEKNLINCIYRATEGEGVFIGRSQIFVRYQGCSVGCLNCDSKETWDFDNKMAMDLTDIIKKINEEGFDGKIKNVSITGGDPLHPSHVPHVIGLVKALKELGYYVNIEAAGTRVVDELFSLVDYISFDFKTPSTGVRTPIANILKMAKGYGQKMQLKAVIADRVDFEANLKMYQEVLKSEVSLSFPWVLTPCYSPDEAFPMKRFQEIIAWNEELGGPFRVIGQQHKWIFGPNEKLV